MSNCLQYRQNLKTARLVLPTVTHRFYHSQDTSPSILDHPIASATNAEHESKRTKFSEASENTTVRSLVETKAYTAIEQVVTDVEIATASIIETFDVASNEDQGGYTAQEARAKIASTAALKRELDRLTLRELTQRPETIVSSRGIKDEPLDEEETNPHIAASGDNVLTLAANTQPSKQLFTSLRKSSDSAEPLNELALPNGITTTRITPLHSMNEEGEKPVPTMKDLFAPPASLPPLPLPKQSRHTATRSSSVNWFNPAEAESKGKPGRRESYINQPLSTGQWLKYSVAPNPTQLTSPETKRKQRDRALSIGEPQTSLSQEAIESHNQAKEEALFRSVYSSFAPDRDNSGALVAEQQKNKIWWNKYGETRYRELLDMRDEEHADLEVVEMDGTSDEDELNEEELEKAIANFKPEDSFPEMGDAKFTKDKPPETSQESDQLLEEISDLLETLHSHQRIRNLPLAANARPIAGQNPQSTTLAGSPSSPSTAEFDVYEILKGQLTLIVSTLPPYLLSKLDGDKLGALKISTKIQVESKNQKGVLEESEASAVARRIAPSATAPVGATQTPNPYSSIPARSSGYSQSATPAQQYPRTGYGPSTAPRPAANSSYLQNPQYSNRPASSNYAPNNSRPSYASQGGYPPRPAAVSSTSSYNYAQQYSQQASQSSYGSYQNGYRPYIGQNVSGYNYNSQYSTPQARGASNSAQTPPAYRETQSEYQQRAVPPQGYGYGSAQAGGSASAQSQHRPSFPGQTPQGPAQQRPPLYHQHSSQYSQTPGSPQVNGNAPSGSPSQQGHLSADEQAALMNRQKAQLAEQQSRQGSGTPQPPSRQYSPQQNGTQQNGTPVPQPNGIAAGEA